MDTLLSCKAERQYLLTLQVSRYRLLALQDRMLACLAIALEQGIYLGDICANTCTVLVGHTQDRTCCE